MNNNSTQKKKEQRQSLYVTIIVILMMVAVVVAIASALAKNDPSNLSSLESTDDAGDVTRLPSANNESENVPSLDTDDVFLDEDEDKNDIGEDKPNDNIDTDKAAEDTSANTDKADSETEKTADILPEFTSPVAGEVLRECSLTVPVFSNTMEDYRTHTGVDLYCEPASDVAAAAAGTVKEIWDDPMMGMCISIEHSGGAESVYKNLCDEIPANIEVGTAVEQGQVIATAGDTALMEIAEESHLHFELSVNGETVDPQDYIEFTSSPVHSD